MIPLSLFKISPNWQSFPDHGPEMPYHYTPQKLNSLDPKQGLVMQSLHPGTSV